MKATDDERHRELRRRGRAEGSDLRLRAGLDRPAAEREDRGPRQDPGARSTPRASSRPTTSAAPPSRRSSRSATWPASRCWRTRRRTRRASPSKRSPATRRCSSRRRFPPWSSPIRRSPGPASPRREAEKQGRKVEVAKFPWRASGRAIAIDRVDGMTKLLIDPDDRAHPRRRHRRVRRRRADRRRRARDRDGRDRVGRQADDPSASDADRDGDGVGRGVLRPGDARLQTASQVAVAISAIPPVLHLHTQDKGAGDLFR